jgi:hypothetical protein
MNKNHLFGTLAVTGALLGCGNASSGKKSTTAASTTTTTTTTPAATSAPTTSASATPPAIMPVATATPAASGLKISSVSPNHGGAGTTVRVSGKGFKAAGAGQTLVFFGTSGALATAVSDTELLATVAAATSAGPVTVRVASDLGIAALASGFAYDARAPRLAFDPAVGHEEVGFGGTRITLRVADFVPLGAGAKVRFGTVDATKVALVDSSTLVAEVPTGVAPGRVALTIEQGTDGVTAADFLVQGALHYGDLTINEFCPHPGGADCNNDGTRASNADEFVEIVNVTKDPIDLSWLTLRDENGERHRFPNPTTLAPGKAIVVFGGGTMHELPSTGQAASIGELGLNNTADTIEIRTLPGIRPSGVGETLFRVDYKNPPSAGSLTNPVDGARITKNPATSADYVDHAKTPTPQGAPYSPGCKADGSRF